MFLVAALVPALGTSLLGASELFFLYFAMTALGTITGVGWVWLFRSRFVVPAVSFTVALWLVSQITLGFNGRLSLIDHQVVDIWVRTDWWRSAVTHRAEIERNPRAQPLGTSRYLRRISLTPEVREGLEWARLNLPADTVFAINVNEASPYGALSESRAFFDFEGFNAKSHIAASQGSHQTSATQVAAILIAIGANHYRRHHPT